MPYINIDCNFPEHPSITALSSGAFRLHILALAWAKRFEREAIPPHMIKVLRRRYGLRPKAVDELLEHNVWFLHDEGYLLSGIHNPRGESRPAIPLGVRYRVFERDGYACLICGSTERLTLDHITPWSQGGADTEDNLRTLCHRCNVRRGAARLTDDELRGTA